MGGNFESAALGVESVLRKVRGESGSGVSPLRNKVVNILSEAEGLRFHLRWRGSATLFQTERAADLAGFRQLYRAPERHLNASGEKRV